MDIVRFVLRAKVSDSLHMDLDVFICTFSYRKPMQLCVIAAVGHVA